MGRRQRFRVGDTKVTTYTSTQFNAEFRAIEDDASEKDEFYQIWMQEFGIQDEDAMDSQKRSLIGEDGDYMKGLLTHWCATSRISCRSGGQSLPHKNLDLEADKADLQKQQRCA